MDSALLLRVDLPATTPRYIDMWSDIVRVNVGRGEGKLGERVPSQVPDLHRFTDPGRLAYPPLLDFGDHAVIRAHFDNTTDRTVYAGIIPIIAIPKLGNLPDLSNRPSPPDPPKVCMTTHLGDDLCWMFVPFYARANWGLLMMMMLGHSRGDCLVY